MKPGFLFLMLLSAVVVNSSCKKYDAGIPAADPPPLEKMWIVSTVAGDGRPVFSDGPSLSASFRLPLDVAVSSDGVIYVADLLNHRIRKISEGMVTTFAGHEVQDTTNGIGAEAGYALPTRLTVDNRNGNLYTLDNADARVRKISPNGTVTTYAGMVEKGFKDGVAPDVQFNSGFGIVADAEGNIYVGDSGNKRIRKIKTDGQVLTVAGNGTAGTKDGPADMAEFYFPQGIVLDKQGNLFVADQNRIRKVTPNGLVSTFAGSDSIGFTDGIAEQASFTLIEDLVIDNQGNIYASDENRIRKISPQGVVSTIAGSTSGYSDGTGSMAKFNGAQGLGIDSRGNIYVADANNSRIRKLSFE